MGLSRIPSRLRDSKSPIWDSESRLRDSKNKMADESRRWDSESHIWDLESRRRDGIRDMSPKLFFGFTVYPPLETWVGIVPPLPQPDSTPRLILHSKSNDTK